MSIIFDNDIIIHHIAAPGLPGDGFTAPEAATLRSDIDALLARPVIDQLTDIPDVTGTPADNDTIFYNGATSEWEMGAPESAIWVERWLDGTTVETVNSSAKRLSFYQGLTAETQAGFPDRILINVQYGGTGTATTTARSDHNHAIRWDEPLPFNESGAISSGTRTLISGTITGLFLDRQYIITATLRGDLRGGGTGAGYTLPSITIGPDTFQRFGGARGEVRTVSGVDREYSMAHRGISSLGNSSVNVSAAIAYRSGDPIIVGAGELTVHIKSAR